jgi:UDP-3-O-[3-hydroxymyristoyl] N-acetylglucosamine deacetylase / 3-hydroxyacyl-[acyl-carrier-protein] dehydratase
MADKQKTIKKSTATIQGKGLHTGVHVELTFHPAPENHGYKFRRVDLPEQPIIHAIVENVVDTSRSTLIEENGVKVGTIEHVLSAVYGLGIDNILIDISNHETPILDGSAREYIDALLEAGIVEQEADKEYYVVQSNITYSDPEHKIEIMIVPDEGFSANVMIDYNSKILSNQFAQLKCLDDYRTEIATCRTFVFLRELEQLLKHNLIKGGDLDSAIVIVDRQVSQDELDHLADLFNQPRVKVKPEGVLNNIELQFPNEPARHKLLDLIGDISLVGQPLKGRILATRPGHFSNVEFARIIKKIIKKEKAKQAIPKYDPTIPALMEIQQIKKLLPHRPPFLLVDKILEITPTSVTGIKNATMNEAFFVGHFPDEPVMPGVLIIEAMAQVGGIMVLSSVPDPENYSTYFLKIDAVKFKRKVVPGDTIIIKLELMDPIRRGLVHMRGQAFVANNLVTEGEFVAQIVKNR